MEGDRFVSPCPLPEPWEDEILKTLIEEAVEAIQRVTKLQRFGRDEVQPGQEFSNRYRLSLEIGDFLGMVKIAQAAGLIDDGGVMAGEIRKPARFEKYRQHRPSDAKDTGGQS